MGKHTLGPWVEDIGRCAIVSLAPEEELSPGNPVTVIDTHGAMGGADCDADVALICAAPDLLEACKAFVVAHDKCLQLEKTDTALRLAKTAIAKAEKEAS